MQDIFLNQVVLGSPGTEHANAKKWLDGEHLKAIIRSLSPTPQTEKHLEAGTLNSKP